jgi:predicted O-methyltransferase YrrM
MPERAARLGALQVIDKLADERPRLHGEGEQDWSIDVAVLRALATRVGPGDRAVETGAGYSTIALAATGADVITIAPHAPERDGVFAWCAANGIATERVEWHVGFSQQVLPTLSGPIDLALIDGGHCFPLPFVDWFYTGSLLRPGGVAFVDDTQLRAPAVLADFLRQDVARWRALPMIGRCAVFERVGSEPLTPYDDWQSQPWSLHRDPRQRVEESFGRLRGAVRLRSRLRALTGHKAS